jgi:predicted nucleic acid-binding protein
MTPSVGPARSRQETAVSGFGQHRRPIPDLLVAATALEHDATVLHYDHDFDVIAEATGLSARWIIPAGTGHGGPQPRR